MSFNFLSLGALRIREKIIPIEMDFWESLYIAGFGQTEFHLIVFAFSLVGMTINYEPWSLEQIIWTVLKRNLDNDYDFGYVLFYVPFVIFGLKFSKNFKNHNFQSSKQLKKLWLKRKLILLISVNRVQPRKNHHIHEHSWSNMNIRNHNIHDVYNLSLVQCENCGHCENCDF